MSRRPNHRFSIERNREATAFEVGVDFIKRRLTGSIFKRDKDLGGPAIPSHRMPPKQPFYEDGSASSSSKRRASTGTNMIGENSEANPDLRAYTDQLASLMQCVSDTSKELRSFQKATTGHAKKIDTAIRNFEQLNELRKEVQDYKAAINALKRENRESEDAIAKSREKLKEEEEQLKKDFMKFEEEKMAEDEALKRKEIDLESRHKKALEKEGAKLEKKYLDEKKELVDNALKKEKSLREEIKILRNEKAEAQKKLEASERKFENQSEQLAGVQTDNENLKRANKTLMEENRALVKELDDARNIFALNKRSTEYYQKQFTQIYSNISAISRRYFQNLEETDAHQVQEQLKAVDNYFSSIPFSNSDNAKALRMAHVQRIISEYIREHIWHPFSIAKVQQNGGPVLLLNTIAEILKSNQGTNGAYISKIWSALTERALQSPELEGPMQDRATKVVQGIRHILLPLVSQEEAQNFTNDILKLSQSAIAVWNASQTDELEIKVCSELDPELREQWRCKELDPPMLPTNKNDKAKADIPSATTKRIFILFPRIEARSFSKTSGSRPTLPGGWPEAETEQALAPVETCIHPGVGLPEWSVLVVRGHEEVERLKKDKEEEERLYQESFQEFNKQWKNRKGGAGGKKKNLVVSVNQGPPSPTEQWKMSGKNTSERSSEKDKD
ncbi:hypothetical protein F5884DRAFT_381804 [Xylogone sp. PMI_703]|nr:hypothetical protein F5884DRAFT_381804 [Xylogone sp. PMI_703]